MASQITGEYEAQDPTMAKYLDKVQTFTSTFEQFRISHTPMQKHSGKHTFLARDLSR